jgi:hypothetical protein
MSRNLHTYADHAPTIGDAAVCWAVVILSGVLILAGLAIGQARHDAAVCRDGSATFTCQTGNGGRS